MVRKRNNKEYLFVDGYNILNSWEGLKEIGKVDLEAARLELIEILAEYYHYTGIEIIVVFDAHMVKGNNGKEENYKGIKIVFTKENETADHYIERTLDSIGRIRRVRVATSDWLEQQLVLSRGGTRISARELELEIINEKNRIKRKSNFQKEKTNLHLGSLDEENLKKLHDWNKSRESLD